MGRKAVNLNAEQAALFAELKQAVAEDTDAEYLTDGDALEAAARAYLGRDGWDDVGKDDGRGRSEAVEDLLTG